MNKRSKRLRIAVMVCAAVAVLLLGGLAAVGNYLFDFALNPAAPTTMKALMDADEVDGLDEPAALDEAFAKEAQSWFEREGQHVEHTAEDGVLLSGWRFDAVGGESEDAAAGVAADDARDASAASVPDASAASHASHDYTVVLHGYTASPAEAAKYGYYFHQRGMHVLMPAARAHERSEGAYIGMGWPERRDVVGWISDIVDRDPQARIVLFGISMGGATAMMTAGEADLPRNVVCVIEDCGYASVWDEFAVQLENVFGLSSFPVLDAANLVCQVRAGWDFKQASAERAVAAARMPMLFIHGDADTFVPYEMLDRVYVACGSSVKEKLVIPGAPHGGSAATDPTTYWGTVAAFLDANFYR